MKKAGIFFLLVSVTVFGPFASGLEEEAEIFRP